MAANNDGIVKSRTLNTTNLGDITDVDLSETTTLKVFNIVREGEPKPLSSRIGECENLTSLWLTGCSSIPPDIVGCTKLSTLYLHSRSGNDDNDCRIELPEIILHNLTTVYFKGNGNWNADEIITWLATSCPNLTFLYFCSLSQDTANHFMCSLQDNVEIIEKISSTLIGIAFSDCNLNEDDALMILYDVRQLYPRLCNIDLRNNNIESIETIGTAMRELPPANNDLLQSNLRRLWFNGNAFLGNLNNPNSSDHAARILLLKNFQSLSQIAFNNKTITCSSVIHYWLMINGSELRYMLDKGHGGTRLSVLPYLMHHVYNQREQDPTTLFTFLRGGPIFRSNYYNNNDDDDDDDDNDNGGGSGSGSGSGRTTTTTLPQLLQHLTDATSVALTHAPAHAHAVPTVSATPAPPTVSSSKHLQDRNNTMKGLILVHGVKEAVNYLKTKYPSIAGDIDVLITKDMAVHLFGKQQEFKDTNIPSYVDMGFHYTCPNNMDLIREHGLLTNSERNEQNIQADKKWGNTFGDGVYTSSNPTAFSYLGKRGLVVARLQGSNVRLPIGQCYHKTSSLVGIENVECVIGNKISGRGLDENGWPTDNHLDEVVLLSSSQVSTMVKYDTSILNTTVGKQCIKQLESLLQILFDNAFNKGHQRAPTGSIIGDKFSRHIDSERELYRQRHTLDYQAPTTITIQTPLDALATVMSIKPDTQCVICLEKLSINGPCVQLTVCGHIYHRSCITRAFEVDTKCPICRELVDKPQGKSPSGSMRSSYTPLFCSGYENNSTIVIDYNMDAGTQKSYHENPGTQHGGKFTTAYVPNNNDGKNLLKRLKYAFMHGLTFTVGTSLTTNIPNQCTWASIHHKTSRYNGGSTSPHGFPDDGYFLNINEELNDSKVPLADSLCEDGSSSSSR